MSQPLHSQHSLVLHGTGFKVAPFIGIPGFAPDPVYITDLGALFKADCLDVLPAIKDGCIDTVFADPPFNLGKRYGTNGRDDLEDSEYVAWCHRWIDECVRILKPGGSLFIYNLPKWNMIFGAYLVGVGMMFRHWIAIDMKNCLPIPGRLYPSHYGLLYFTKGKPRTFGRIRTPIEKCRHCGGEIRDYGGHRGAMNPNGVNLKDIWTDIPPVRHWSFKSRKRTANALSTKILDRVVEISTMEGDVIVDPFGGSGTTFAVCEKKHRHWIGMEVDFTDVIIDRLDSGQIRHHKNDDYVER